MADWTPIGNGELVADQPITESLLTRLRDNPIAMIERAAGAPTYGWTVTSTGGNANGQYRVWDDGYIEQWGFAATTSSTFLVTFPISFVIGDITASVIGHQYDGSGGGYGDRIRTITITTLDVSHYHVGSMDGFYWMAQGY